MFAIAWTMPVAQVSAQHAFSASDALVTIDRRSVRFIVRLPLDEVDLLLRLDRDLDGEVAASWRRRGRRSSPTARNIFTSMPITRQILRSGTLEDR